MIDPTTDKSRPAPTGTIGQKIPSRPTPRRFAPAAFDNRRTGASTGASQKSAAALSADFWRQWLEHKSYLLQLAQRWMSGNRADAEDILSRASIRAHDRYLRDAARIRNLRSWMARVLHNLCMDEHRKRVVRGRMLQQFHPEQLEYLAVQSRMPAAPEQQAEQGDEISAAMTAIMDMPPRLRHPFVLRFIYQYSNQEIARHLLLSEVNVRKRIQLGRSLVRGQLEQK